MLAEGGNRIRGGEVASAFRVGLTHDLSFMIGSASAGDTGLGILGEAPGLEWEFLPEEPPELGPQQVQGYDALVVLGPRVPASALESASDLTVVARFGVGYDNVDIDACTRNGIAVTITPDGVRRPMATAIMTFMLALGGRLFQKDRLARNGAWGDKQDFMGLGLTGRVLGSVGLGNIARELFALARPFEMRHIAYDPYVALDAATGVELVDLPTLFSSADFLVINCALTTGTHHLVNAERLSLMKPTAFLINTARGPIVDQVALTDALIADRLAGAALDVFEHEPVDPNDPILSLENVIVSPHALGWTDEWIHLSGRSAFGGILDVAAGREPPHVVNREVLGTPEFQHKLKRYAERRRA